MKRKKRAQAAGGRRKRSTSRTKRTRDWRTWHWLIIAATLLIPAVIYDSASTQSFRLPKLIVSEVLALASLMILVQRLRSTERIRWRGFFSEPSVQIASLLFAAAAVGLVTSEHSGHVTRGLSELAVGLAALIGWSVLLRREEIERVLCLLLLPATVLAGIALLQRTELLVLFPLEGVGKDRLELTSLAGGVFDLSAYLVLPCLVAQVLVKRTRLRWVRAAALLTLLLSLITIALTQTIGSILAVFLGTVIVWSGSNFRRLIGVSSVAALGGVALVSLIAPLRDRLMVKLAALARGDLDRFLTGRLDGWNAALWMFREQPLTGVGHGAYRAEFGEARLSLWNSGVEFYSRQTNTFFANAHSDLLEVVAEWGLVGVAAVITSMLILIKVIRRRIRLRAEDSGLLFGGLAAILILSAMSFPWRLALVVYPWLLFFAWILTSTAAEASDES